MARCILALLLGLTMAAAGCTPIRGGRGGGGGSGDDDDDATGDDDDDATGDDDDATGDDDDATGNDGWSHSAGDLPCDEEGAVDVWLVTLGEGDTLSVQVDTVAAATTFDPAVGLYLDGDPDTGEYLGGGDDEFDCTFPPPSYSCPAIQLFMEEPGSVGIVIHNYGCADESGLAAYDLQTQINGQPASPSLSRNDYILGEGAVNPPPP